MSGKRQTLKNKEKRKRYSAKNPRKNKRGGKKPKERGKNTTIYSLGEKRK